MTTLPRESARDVLHQSECSAVSDDRIDLVARFHLHLQHDNEEGSCRWLRVVGPYQTFKQAVSSNNKCAPGFRTR